MWVFCKNEIVKQKKQALDVQIYKNFVSTDADALRDQKQSNLAAANCFDQQRKPKPLK